MEIVETDIPGVRILRPKAFGDSRGTFSETYNRRVFADAGLDVEFVQDNQVHSAFVGTLRGLHFQRPPHAQAKLVRVILGTIFDVAVDIRRGSPTFGRHVAVRLDGATGDQIFIPAGFAHGYCTLVPDTTVFYKVTAYYAPKSEAGLLWNDPALKIDWPIERDKALLAPRDSDFPTLADLPEYFSAG